MPATFLSLAGELRNQIYDLVFSEKKWKDLPGRTPGQHNFVDMPGPAHPLLQVSRQLRHETLNLYYSTHMFSFDCKWMAYDDPSIIVPCAEQDKRDVKRFSQHLVKWLENIGQDAREHIKGIELHFDMASDNLTRAWDLLGEEMEGRDLEKFRPCYPGNPWEVWYDGKNEDGSECCQFCWPRTYKMGKC